MIEGHGTVYRLAEDPWFSCGRCGDAKAWEGRTSIPIPPSPPFVNQWSRGIVCTSCAVEYYEEMRAGAGPFAGAPWGPLTS